MEELLRLCVLNVCKDVPILVYLVLLTVLCIAAYFVFSTKCIKNKTRAFYRIILLETIILIYSSTLFCRIRGKSTGYNYELFWSYTPNRDDWLYLLAENIMNVIVFVPVGFLLGLSFFKMEWWKVLLVGISLSASIEMMQFVFNKGFSEVDDVLHNTLGCIIGFGLYKITEYGRDYTTKKGTGL